jgi:hypothetical protein
VLLSPCSRFLSIVVLSLLPDDDGDCDDDVMLLLSHTLNSNLFSSLNCCTIRDHDNADDNTCDACDADCNNLILVDTFDNTSHTFATRSAIVELDVSLKSATSEVDTASCTCTVLPFDTFVDTLELTASLTSTDISYTPDDNMNRVECDENELVSMNVHALFLSINDDEVFDDDERRADRYRYVYRSGCVSVDMVEKLAHEMVNKVCNAMPCVSTSLIPDDDDDVS